MAAGRIDRDVVPSRLCSELLWFAKSCLGYTFVQTFDFNPEKMILYRGNLG